MSKTKEQQLLEQLVADLTELKEEDARTEAIVEQDHIVEEIIRRKQQKRDAWDIKHPILAEIRNWIVYKLKKWQGKV